MLKRIAVILIVGLSMVNGSALASAATKPRWFQPIMVLPTSAIQTFRCVIYAESRSTFTHPNLGDNNANGSSGIFQMTPILWNAWAPKVGVHVPVWRASPYQQALVAAEVWRVDRFSPWTRYDGCV